jgi:hypothetical protein
MKVDKVARTIRRSAREAWNKLKRWLLYGVEQFEKVAPGKYVSEINSYLRRDDGAIEEVSTTRPVKLDDIPDDIRAKFIQNKRAQIDILGEREAQLLLD